MLQLTLKHTVDAKLEKQFDITKERINYDQRNPLSAILFNFELEKVLRDSNLNRSSVLYRKT